MAGFGSGTPKAFNNKAQGREAWRAHHGKGVRLQAAIRATARTRHLFLCQSLAGGKRPATGSPGPERAASRKATGYWLNSIETPVAVVPAGLRRAARFSITSCRDGSSSQAQGVSPIPRPKPPSLPTRQAFSWPRLKMRICHHLRHFYSPGHRRPSICFIALLTPDR